MIATAQWLPRIAGARSEHDLVMIVREYVLAWPPADREKIPPHCRVGVISSGQEISYAAVTLVQCELKGGMDEETAGMVRLMADVFVAAQSRLREILARHSDPSSTAFPKPAE